MSITQDGIINVGSNSVTPIVKTTSFTADAGGFYAVDTTAGAVTITMPASPSAGNKVTVLDYKRNFGTNNCIFNFNGKKAGSQTNNYTLSSNGNNIEFTYIDDTQGWLASNFFTWAGVVSLVGNALIQSILTTSLSSFNAAANNIAVSITQTEWDALNVSLASASGGKAGCTNTQLTTTLNSGNSTVFSGDYTDHTFGNLTNVPANKRIYGFALNIRVASTNGTGRIKAFVGDAGTDLHSNNLAIGDTTTPVYYVIKTPPAVSVSSQIIGSYISVSHFKFRTGVSAGYRYASGNTNTGPFTAGNNESIPCIQFAYGGS
ncbi:MAG: hypothetical protein EBU90_19960 [Proteobacteria bacterium]|nr:hypothetical protein [Pseudomonadota bacterium]